MSKTGKQILGTRGEQLIMKLQRCSSCKSKLDLLPANFKCADLVCTSCGKLSQVKTRKVKRFGKIPKSLLGAAWGPQKERIENGELLDLYIVLISDTGYEMYLLEAKHQKNSLFIPRKPLSITARRAGWQGFYYDIKSVEGHLQNLTQ